MISDLVFELTAYPKLKSMAIVQREQFFMDVTFILALAINVLHLFVNESIYFLVSANGYFTQFVPANMTLPTNATGQTISWRDGETLFFISVLNSIFLVPFSVLCFRRATV